MALIFYGYGRPSEDATKVDQYVDTSTGQIFYNMIRGDSENGRYREMVPTGQTWAYQNVTDASGKPIYGTQGYHPQGWESDEGGMSTSNDLAGYTQAGYQLGNISDPNNPETKLANYSASKGYPPKYDPNYGWVIPSSAPVNSIRESYASQFHGGGSFINQLLDAGVPLYLMMAAVTGGALGGASLGTTIGTELGLTGTAATTTGNAIVAGVQNLAATGDLNSAIVSAVASGAGNLTGAEAVKLLPEGTDPKLIKSLSGATSGAVGAAIKKGDVGQSALIGGVAPVISDQLTSTPAPGTPTTDPYPRGEISITGMEPTITPAPDQGGVPTPPSVDTPIITDINAPITDAEVVAQIQPTGMDEPGYEAPPDQGGVPTPPEASVNPDLPPAQRLEEVLVEDTRLPQEDEEIMDLTGIMPSKTKMPVPTSPVTSKDLADPTVDNAPPPDKKSDYTGEISALLNALFSRKSGGGVGSGGSYDLGGGGGGGSTGPSSAALAGALRTDAGAPIFGGEKKGKKRNVWNIESLRTKDETGA